MPDYCFDSSSLRDSPLPKASAPSWQKDLTVEERDKKDKDFVIRTTGKRSETILDLTGKSAKTPYSLHPESDKDIERKKLEATKRALANGNRGWLNKEWSAAAMQDVQRKLKKLMPRKNAVPVNRGYSSY